MKTLNAQELARQLDLANHHPEATRADIQALCTKVLKYGFNAAFVNPYFVADARRWLGGQAKVGTVVAFPLGQELLEIKVASVAKAIEAGADELDVSLNVGLLKGGQAEEFADEARTLVAAAKAQKPAVIVKLIIETGCLTEEEIKKAAAVVLASGADFVKTSSGLGPRGASLRDIELIKEVVGDKIKIKAAGGIDTLAEAMAFFDHGVSRIGTSKAVAIIEELGNENH